jgi:Flavoprotein
VQGCNNSGAFDLSNNYIIQNPQWSCFSSNQKVGFVSQRDAKSALYESSAAEIVHEIWRRSVTPRCEGDLVSELVGMGCPQDVVANAVVTLLQQEVLLSGDEPQLSQLLQTSHPAELSCDHLLVCMSGAIQSASFSPFLTALRFRFCRQLKIILTKSAYKLVKKRALVHLLDAEVFSDTFEDASGDFGVPHISLSEWASCILIAPATAASIFRIAHATCDDLLSLTVTATPHNVPVIIGPSMNTKMWHNPAVQENISLCRKRGYWIIEPGLGYEVNTEWNNRVPRVGVFGAQPASLVRILADIYAMYKSTELPA